MDMGLVGFTIGAALAPSCICLSDLFLGYNRASRDIRKMGAENRGSYEISEHLREDSKYFEGLQVIGHRLARKVYGYS